MTKDEIENKIQLEIIKVNKTIANNKRATESKEKINWRASMSFAWSAHNPRKKKKRKAIFGQTMPNHHIRITQRRREHRDKSNDMTESQSQPLVAHAVKRQQRSKIPLELNNNDCFLNSYP